MDSASRRLYLCLDQGGHASRALVFDNHGELCASAFRDIATHRDGLVVEHDPRQLVQSLREAATEAIRQLGSAAIYLDAAGLATQRSSIVCWERNTGAPLSPVLSWQDTRAAGWLDQFMEQQELIHDITGLVVSPHYGVSKLRWCMDHLPAVSAALLAGNLVAGPLASYLANQLSNASPLLADPANASRTLLWDRRRCDWSADLLELFSIPGECLPKCVPSRSDWGDLELDGMHLPLGLVTGDQSAALFAFGDPAPGTVYANLGTGAFLQRSSAVRGLDPGRLLASVVYQDESSVRQVIEGTVNGAGSAINKVAGDMGIGRMELRENSGAWLAGLEREIVFLNGVSGLGSPWWQADMPSSFAGAAVADATGAEQIAAVMESVVFLLATNLAEMTQIAGRPERLLVTGGLGGVDALLQKLANIARLPVERAHASEATARGVAYLLAGLPDNWPRPQVETCFKPLADPGLRQRFAIWRELMPPIGD